MMFQKATLLEWRTALENVLLPTEIAGTPTRADKNRAFDLLKLVGLEDFAFSFPAQLSGGMQQRVALARLLQTGADILLLDEPFAGVDPIAVEDIQSIVYDLKKKNIGILITDHNVQETLSITDRTYLLFEGSILKSGTAEELASDEQVRRVYLGRNFELKKKVPSE